ncbi:10572_t:CDS:2 [Paraglomus occultum]|uniref:10572_t:CDS:1 n=1 Tax=Paraglomus occultum TaxID=144539 RepID=A0A9N9FIB7_9GLOM|nr:10572_t:CDS:2 [Paraglomus occultum]
MNSDEELYEETLRYENEIYRDPLDHEISDRLSLTDTSSLSTIQSSSPSSLFNTPSKVRAETTFDGSFETPSRTSLASQSSIRSQSQIQPASSRSSYYLLKTSSSSSSSPSSPPRANLNFSEIEESKYGINHAHVRMQIDNPIYIPGDGDNPIYIPGDEDTDEGEDNDEGEGERQEEREEINEGEIEVLDAEEPFAIQLISATNTTTSTDAIDLSEEFDGPPVKKSNRYFMLNHCPLCKQLGHLKINCSRNRKINQSAVRSANKLEDVWRKYKYEVDCDFDKNVRSFCYTCGVRGHFGDECKSTSTGYSAFSKYHITKAEKHIMDLREKAKEAIAG